jgi:hypothetical protein
MFDQIILHFPIMSINLLDSFISATGVDLKYHLSSSAGSEIDMSDDEISVSDGPGQDDSLLSEQSVLEKQRAALQVYLNSVPYECESVEEMQTKLEEIVGKIMICAHAKNWLSLTTWDGMLQWCALNPSSSDPVSGNPH